MCMQIDEAGRDHEPGGVDHALGTAKRGADGGDLAVHDRHIANRVHSAGGIHHPATRDHQAAHVVTPKSRCQTSKRPAAASEAGSVA